jgi:hypothetical protein
LVSTLGCFRDVVGVCSLVDLGYIGRSWTFERKVTRGTFTRARLDQDLATTNWSAMFPNSSLQHRTSITSDHDPILLVLHDGIVARG